VYALCLVMWSAQFCGSLSDWGTQLT